MVSFAHLLEGHAAHVMKPTKPRNLPPTTGRCFPAATGTALVVVTLAAQCSAHSSCSSAARQTVQHWPRHATSSTDASVSSTAPACRNCSRLDPPDAGLVGGPWLAQALPHVLATLQRDVDAASGVAGDVAREVARRRGADRDAAGKEGAAVGAARNAAWPSKFGGRALAVLVPRHEITTSMAGPCARWPAARIAPPREEKGAGGSGGPELCLPELTCLCLAGLHALNAVAQGCSLTPSVRVVFGTGTGTVMIKVWTPSPLQGVCRGLTAPSTVCVRGCCGMRVSVVGSANVHAGA